VVVAVLAVRVVQVVRHDVVGVIPVGERFVAAAGTVLVTGSVPATHMPGSTAIGVRLADGHDMLVGVPVVDVMQVTVVEIIRVSLVADGCVPAARSVLVRPVVRVLRAAHSVHLFPGATLVTGGRAARENRLRAEP
jgi:hypothetical protein